MRRAQADHPVVVASFQGDPTLDAVVARVTGVARKKAAPPPPPIIAPLPVPAALKTDAMDVDVASPVIVLSAASSPKAMDEGAAIEAAAEEATSATEAAAGGDAPPATDGDPVQADALPPAIIDVTGLAPPSTDPDVYEPPPPTLDDDGDAPPPPPTPTAVVPSLKRVRDDDSAMDLGSSPTASDGTEAPTPKRQRSEEA
jgi:hypothetical protein